MRKILCLVLVALMAIPAYALAEAKLGDVLLGPWSAWSTHAPVQTDGVVVETRTGSKHVTKNVFTYRRFEYFNTKKGMWYATSTAEPGTAMQAGSGRWVTKTFDEKLPQVGLVNLQKCYQGQWFYEEMDVQDLGDVATTEYRYRTKTVVQCTLGRHDAAIARGSTYQIEPEVADGVKITYQSADTSVATVDLNGLVKGVGIGQADINLMVGGNRVACLRLSVGERLAGLASGSYAIQLIGTDEFLSPIGGVAKQGASLFTANYIPEAQRLFRFQGVAESAFRVRLVSPQMLYLSVRDKGKRVGLYGRSNKYGQSFSILRLKGGQDLIYLADDPTQFLAVSRTGQLEMREFETLSTSIRWKLTKEGEEQKQSATWHLPYQQNGKCYMSQNFSFGVHNGVDVGSGGERVPALSVADGKVIETWTGCEHDYGKKTNGEGNQVDPCGEKSYGNYVIVQHANGMRTMYAHLSRVLVKKGDRVNQGDFVGITGSTGSSTAVHLHLEVRDSGNNPLNPRLFMEFPAVKKE